MPLSKLQIAPGIDKQNTEYGAEGRGVDCDNVRFRYGLPEKIGGWEKVTSDALVGDDVPKPILSAEPSAKKA